VSLRTLLLGPPRRATPACGHVDVLGVPLVPLDTAALATRLVERIASGERGLAVFTPDAWAMSRTLIQPHLADLYRNADLVACDGTGVAWAARAYGNVMPRCPGADLAGLLCAAAQERGLRVYLLGGRPGVAEEAAGALAHAMPGLRIVGTHHGYFSGSGPVADIAALHPDLVFVGMGFPRQERWILAHRHAGGALLGVGGTLDFWAGRCRRAPAWVRRNGLEWLWRVTVQPRRITRLWCVPFLGYHIALGHIRRSLAGKRHPAP